MATQQIQLISHAQTTQVLVVITSMTIITIFATKTDSAFPSFGATFTEDHAPITIGIRL
jgi:hypothetical protein